MRQEILQARAFVLPSFAEGLPVVLMEALALYRPVVTTFIAGIPELVEQGECGWLIPAGSIEKLATALRDVLQTPVQRLEPRWQRLARSVYGSGTAPVPRRPSCVTYSCRLRRKALLPRVEGESWIYWCKPFSV